MLSTYPRRVRTFRWLLSTSIPNIRKFLQKYWTSYVLEFLGSLESNLKQQRKVEFYSDSKTVPLKTLFSRDLYLMER